MKGPRRQKNHCRKGDKTGQLGRKKTLNGQHRRQEIILLIEKIDKPPGPKRDAEEKEADAWGGRQPTGKGTHLNPSGNTKVHCRRKDGFLGFWQKKKFRGVPRRRRVDEKKGGDSPASLADKEGMRNHGREAPSCWERGRRELNVPIWSSSRVKRKRQFKKKSSREGRFFRS